MVADHRLPIRLRLGQGLATAQELMAVAGISQPTLSRVLASLDDEVLRLGAARSRRYALRDPRRGPGAVPVHRVDPQGQLSLLGHLSPVCPEGYVMRQTDGTLLHSEGLPWWLLDMRPQGFLGRAFAVRHAAALGLPPSLADWSDHDALRALQAQGHDAVGNLLLGDAARTAFLARPEAAPLPRAGQGRRFAELARQAAQGELPGSSAGGEQPKFTTWAETPDGPAHLIVKFSLPADNPITQRWRDLLLAEHHALRLIAEAGWPAARSHVVDHRGQRFLAVERFDRVGPHGRRAILSLAALDAEFVGAGAAPWPAIVERLCALRVVHPDALLQSQRLNALGTLIGNTDMHTGNLAFVTEEGRPYRLAPAYDMLPMGLAPRASGAVAHDLPPLQLRPEVPHPVWHEALALAHQYLTRLSAEKRFSAAFEPAMAALAARVQGAGAVVARLV